MNYYPFHIGEPFQTQLEQAISQRDVSTNPRERSRANARIRSIRLAAARAKGSHTADEWNDLCQRMNWRCAMCGVYGSSVVLQKDHVTPIYQGGSDAIDNLQPLCLPCNTAKGPDATNWAAYRLEHGYEE